MLSDLLNMWHIAAKFVLRLMSNDQKEYRVAVCSERKEQTENDPNFISTIITGDESWVYGYDPGTKQQSSQWKTPSPQRPKKARQVRSNVKSRLICLFDTEGIVHKEFVPSGQTVNRNFYCNVLRRLKENVWGKRPVKWQNNSWALHHDNAPALTSLLVRQFLTSTKMTVISHPPYSPDLAPWDFFLFPKMILKLKGWRFGSTGEIRAELQDVKMLTQNDFQQCFRSWKSRWDCCINEEGGTTS
jgi:hypothetical protein